MNSERKIVVLHNPALHLRRQLLFKRLQKKLPKSALIIDSSGDYAADLVHLKEACKDADLLISVGGDGTLNLAVNAIAGTSTVLGVLPAGSGNDFARIWVAGLSTDDRIDTALNGNPMSIDLGKVNERYFLNIAGIGFDAHLIESLRHKTWPRGFSYILKALPLLPLYKAREIAVEDASAKVNSGSSRRSFMLTLGNGRYFGAGLPITPHARVNDGLLAYCHLKEGNRLGTIWRLARMVFQKHLNAVNVQTGQLSEITVTTPGIPIQADGEYLGVTPAQISIQPGALRINKP
ncbi:hypothetical protein CWE09_01690 [Aliidiomarina minuta]|uniref:DAGKc domain-containing protein n=1 Tax=Aliidiomarina minuta TaxID=880057 RepID=A0A432W5X9_9GAMM|nr:diacylglycerol kinase family protein [Aliidiomarina minuta]RUO25475.1 hypothetical protein CWE09_01690 [Aliidiomarina minuta]